MLSPTPYFSLPPRKKKKGKKEIGQFEWYQLINLPVLEKNESFPVIFS